MIFRNSFQGSILVQLVSADPAAALRAVSEKGITVYDAAMDPDGLTCSFRIPRQAYEALEKLAMRRGDELKMLEKKGIFWTLKSLIHRPVLCGGMLIMFLLTMLIPSRIFFFRVEGNSQISTNEILSIAQDCGIRFGMSRRELRSEKMKNALLEAIPQLQWAGINTAGCVATITVRERYNVDSTPSEGGVSSIVASRDGVIQELTVVRGNGVCKVGQAVKAGQVLISGYTDCGLSIRATRAQGEIYASTQRELTVISPMQWIQKGEEKTSSKKFALIFGKNRINFYKGSGISPSSCVKMYSESYLTLPGGFQLPVALVTEVWTEYESAQCVVTEEDTVAMMEEYANKYLSQQMIAGQILSGLQELASQEGVAILHGKYACREMIGQVRSEEIIR